MWFRFEAAHARWARVVLAAALAAVGVAGPAATAVAAPAVPTTAGLWRLTGSMSVPSGTADQGIATVTVSGGRTTILTRGSASTDPELREQGWIHIGDPDSYDGYILDAYQGTAAAKTKLFVLTAPNGTVTRYVHALVPGETYHNSFTAIAPGGRWFVSGEWGTMRRLLVFPMPGTGPDATPGRNLPLAATIDLTHPVRNVQGCAFASSTHLVCSTNDPGTDLFPISKQLLDVQLARPLDGRTSTAGVHLLGAVPQYAAGCPISGETEGLDIHGGRMLLNVASACSDDTTVYIYRRA